MFRKILIIFSYILLFISFAEASVLLDRVVAIVDRDIITWSELYKAMSFEYEAKLRGYSNEEKKSFLESRQEQFLERLIDMRLQIAEAKRRGISVSDAEIRSAINDTRRQFGLNDEQFKEALRREGFEYNDYLKRIRDQILIQKFIQFEIRSKIVIPDKEVEDYFDQHNDEFPLELSYRLTQLKLKKSESDSEKREIDAIISKIQEYLIRGVDFDQIIMDLGNNPSVQFAGNTDFIPASDLRKDLLNIIKALNEGEISPPLYTDDGVYIIKLSKKQIPVKLEVIKDKIRNLLLSKRSEKNYKSWAKGLRQKALIEILL